MLIFLIHNSIGKKHVLVCWEAEDEQEVEKNSVSAVPATHVSTPNLLDHSIGEMCKVIVESKRYPARIAAVGKFKIL